MPLDAWRGDGFPEDDDEAIELLKDLGFINIEIEELERIFKREAWAHERAAKYEDHDYNIAVARFYWRRAQRLKELARKMEASRGTS